MFLIIDFVAKDGLETAKKNDLSVNFLYFPQKLMFFLSKA